jgi:hypothetical protein
MTEEKNMTAYCGMNCTKCECYQATKENDDNLRAKVAEKWSKNYNSDIKPIQINCTGCKAEGAKFYFTGVCPLRKCNMEKNTPNCAGCSQYRCETLNNFIAKAPAVGKALEKLR